MRIAMRRSPGKHGKGGYVHQMRPWSGGPRYISVCGYNASKWTPVVGERDQFITCSNCLDLMVKAHGWRSAAAVEASAIPRCPCCGQKIAKGGA